MSRCNEVFFILKEDYLHFALRHSVKNSLLLGIRTGGSFAMAKKILTLLKKKKKRYVRDHITFVYLFNIESYKELLKHKIISHEVIHHVIYHFIRENGKIKASNEEWVLKRFCA